MIRASWPRIAGALFTLAGFVLCIVALGKLGFRQDLANFAHAGIVATLFATALAALIASAFSWRNYLLALSGHRLAFGAAFYQVALVLTGKYVPIILGGVFARVAANAGRVRPASVVGATLLEQCGALAAATWVGAACIAGAYVPVAGIALLVLAFAAALIAPACAKPVLAIILWLRARFRREPAIAGEVSDRRAASRAWIAQVVQWVVLSLFVGTVLHAMRPDLPSADLLKLCGAYGVAVVVGIAAFMFPGGLGPREATFIWIAGHVVDYDVALAMASALRVAMTGIDLLAGAGYLLHWTTHAIEKRSFDTP
ncbi:MAG TPA: lysylphosphatidylglycerol synthase domain-containing protein [Rhodanobacteraceae bacterium]|nr:lysylphosphatidylglycerol synthase domain-containing protein [Rhodanobacteraceae bacterium]